MLRLTQSLRTLSLISNNAARTAVVRTPVQLRAFASTPTILKTAASPKATKPKAKKVKKSKPVKTEAQLAKAAERKEKKKAELKEKKVKELTQLKKDLKEAIRKPVKRSGFNLFVSENYDTDLKETVNRYTYLTEPEKDDYKERVKVLNDKKLAEYLEGKPKKPISSYAKFTKENYATYKADSLVETSKILKNQWNQLTPEEKKSYSAVNFDAAAYKAQLKAWKEKRLAAYLAEKAIQNGKRRGASKAKKE
ncbi:hypothetical protein CLIB1423_05S04148 [[Candida] railenensis]|uniref:HMG box domain-containing protein n=1 Tax=[Candida] railenensis TaxID=45579 RepID=A0A9P0QNM3_9ASCO|nr:hypothetical protein CLIB1423_05S04148 [[Candida] railenensis]